MTGLELVDVSDHSAPRLLSTQETPGYQRAVSTYGSRAFIVDQPTGVIVFDVTEPESPRELGTHPTLSALARTVTMGDLDPDRAYIVYERTGLIDAGRYVGTRPVHVCWGLTPPTVDLNVSQSTGSHLYVPTGRDGVEVVDMTNPTVPTVIATYDTPGEARMIEVIDRLIVLADGDALLLLRQP